MNKLSDFDRGYISGLLDGEGTITISKHKQYNRKTESYQYRPFLWITNTDKEMLEHVYRVCGAGTITINKHKTDKNKTCYVFRLVSIDNIIDLLEQIKHGLITKKDRCDILLEFLYSRKNNMVRSHYSKPYTLEEIKLHEKIKLLNKR